MKLTTYAWIMTAVVFVGTLPHAVGAMFQQQMDTMKVVAEQKNISKVPLSEMKRLAKKLGRQEVMARYNSTYEWKSLFTL